MRFDLCIMVFFTVFFISFVPCETAAQVKGQLDLRNWSFEEDGITDLKGDWEFYWHKLLNPEDFLDSKRKVSGYASIPSQFAESVNSDFGFATYRLTVLLPNQNELLALKFLEINSAFRLYLNGELVTANGTVGKSKAESIPFWQPHSVTFYPKEQVELILHVSNYHFFRGGPWSVIKIGTSREIREFEVLKATVNFLLIGSILTMFLYHLESFFPYQIITLILHPKSVPW